MQSTSFSSAFCLAATAAASLSSSFGTCFQLPSASKMMSFSSSGNSLDSSTS